jgi:hypothetical protein
VAALLPVRRKFIAQLTSPIGGTAMRAGFLLMAILAFIALATDRRDLNLVQRGASGPNMAPIRHTAKRARLSDCADLSWPCG